MPLFKRKRKFPLRVEDIMSTPPITVHRDTPIEDAAKIMYENNIGSVLVVDGEGKLVGITTERDLIYAIVDGKIGKRLPIWMIMTEDPITAKPDEPIIDAITKMKENNIRHLPVVDDERKPVGVISLRDITDASWYFLQILHRELE